MQPQGDGRVPEVEEDGRWTVRVWWPRGGGNEGVPRAQRASWVLLSSPEMFSHEVAESGLYLGTRLLLGPRRQPPRAHAQPAHGPLHCFITGQRVYGPGINPGDGRPCRR